MKALSIKQPWASLIAAGIKDIENRSRKTTFRGRIAIHASLKPSFWSMVDGLEHSQITKVAQYNVDNPSKMILSNVVTHPFAAIIGEVDIIDCVKNHPSVWAEKDCYNWVLANAKLYDQPILNVKGALSFWEFTTEEKKKVGQYFKNFSNGR